MAILHYLHNKYFFSNFTELNTYNYDVEMGYKKTAWLLSSVLSKSLGWELQMFSPEEKGTQTARFKSAASLCLIVYR